MKSTGEVMGIGKTPAEAFFKAQAGAGMPLPQEGSIFISVNDPSKPQLLDAINKAKNAGYTIIATANTAKFLNDNGVETESVLKVHEGRRMDMPPSHFFAGDFHNPLGQVDMAGVGIYGTEY